jgi:hypothetical protein
MLPVDAVVLVAEVAANVEGIVAYKSLSSLSPMVYCNISMIQYDS